MNDPANILSDFGAKISGGVSIGKKNTNNDVSTIKYTKIPPKFCT